MGSRLQSVSYKQYNIRNRTIDGWQIQAREGSFTRTKVLLGYRAAPVHVAPDYDPYSKMVASPVLLGWH